MFTDECVALRWYGCGGTYSRCQAQNIQGWFCWLTLSVSHGVCARCNRSQTHTQEWGWFFCVYVCVCVTYLSRTHSRRKPELPTRLNYTLAQTKISMNSQKNAVWGKMWNARTQAHAYTCTHTLPSKGGAGDFSAGAEKADDKWETFLVCL